MLALDIGLTALVIAIVALIIGSITCVRTWYQSHVTRMWLRTGPTRNYILVAQCQTGKDDADLEFTDAPSIIGGHLVAQGDYVLVSEQSDGRLNGLYEASSSNGRISMQLCRSMQIGEMCFVESTQSMIMAVSDPPTRGAVRFKNVCLGNEAGD